MDARQTTRLLDLISIEEAAKRYHMRREYAKAIAVDAGIEIPIGSSHLRVHVPDFERAILARRGKRQRRMKESKPRVSTSSLLLNPRVKC